MNLKQAMERIEALERRVKELEARPEQHIHYHTHPAPIIPHYDLVPPPLYPQTPWTPHWNSPQFGANAIGGGSSN